MNIEQTIARQQAEKKRLSAIVKTPKPPSKKVKRITEDDVKNAVVAALESVAYELSRVKARETPGWSPAYYSACSVIEKKISEVKNGI